MVVSEDAGSKSFLAYHRRRADEERRLAERATDVCVKRAHTELADRHQALADGDLASNHSAIRVSA